MRRQILALQTLALCNMAMYRARQAGMSLANYSDFYSFIALHVRCYIEGYLECECDKEVLCDKERGSDVPLVLSSIPYEETNSHIQWRSSEVIQ